MLGWFCQKSIAVEISPEHLNQFLSISADCCFQAGCNCQTCSLEVFLDYCLQGTSCHLNIELSTGPKIVIQLMSPRIFYRIFAKLPTWFHPPTFQFSRRCNFKDLSATKPSVSILGLQCCKVEEVEECNPFSFSLMLTQLHLRIYAPMFLIFCLSTTFFLAKRDILPKFRLHDCLVNMIGRRCCWYHLVNFPFAFKLNSSCHGSLDKLFYKDVSD